MTGPAGSARAVFRTAARSRTNRSRPGAGLRPGPDCDRAYAAAGRSAAMPSTRAVFSENILRMSSSE